MHKVCVLTGATSGIGRATALALAEANVHVALLGRNQRSATSVLGTLQRGSASGGRIFHVDLSNLDDVRRAAAEIRRAYDAIDILVNNAGARFSTYETTAKGLERTFATNHLGHFLLTALLLDRLRSSSSARIITLGSAAHWMQFDGNWLLGRDAYERRAAYGQSKLANIMFAYELARRLRGTSVVSNALDPGGVATNIGRNNGTLAWLRHLAYYAAKRELQTPRRAARFVADLALADQFRGVTGSYFSRGRRATSSPASHDPGLMSQLWALSVQLTGLDADVGEAWTLLEPGAPAL